MLLWRVIVRTYSPSILVAAETLEATAAIRQTQYQDSTVRIMVEHGRAAAAAADLNKLAAANSVIDSNYGSDDEVATVSCGTTAGDVVLEFHRHWSPAGYDRAVALFERGFYDRSHFFRTVPNFLVQFGISYSHDAALQKLARTPIPDDPQLEPAIPFVEGTISYAGSYSTTTWKARCVLAAILAALELEK